MKTSYEFTPATADLISACIAVGITTGYGNIIQRRDALEILKRAKNRFRFSSGEELIKKLKPFIDELERIRDSEVV